MNIPYTPNTVLKLSGKSTITGLAVHTLYYSSTHTHVYYITHIMYSIHVVTNFTLCENYIYMCVCVCVCNIVCICVLL